jgi:hypothetical protein
VTYRALPFSTPPPPHAHTISTPRPPFLAVFVLSTHTQNQFVFLLISIYGISQGLGETYMR